MSKAKGKRKRFVYVPGDILEDVTEVAKRRGESLSMFVEETLKQALNVNHLGYSREQATELLQVMNAHRILGGAFMPLGVLNYLTTKAYETEKEELQTKGYESGKWHGKYIKEKFEDPVQALKCFLEATRWDLSEVEVKQDENVVKLRCVSTVLTTEATELLAKFVEGAMHSIGYQTKKSDTLKGMIVFEFKR